jgi:hypothetical protein
MFVSLAFRNIVAPPETFDPLNPPEAREEIQYAIQRLVETFHEVNGWQPYRNDHEGIQYGFVADNRAKANELAEDFRRQFERHNQTWLTSAADSSILVPANIFKIYRFEHQIACVANMYAMLAVEKKIPVSDFEYRN